MPSRQNPFFRYQNPYLAQGFGGLAAAMFPAGADPRMQSGAEENMAQARQAQSVANFNAERTRGERFANDVRASSPTSIAELLLGGGVMQDDPLQINPDYTPRQATNFADVLTAPVPDQPASAVFLPNRSAQDKLAEAITWAANNKVPLDQVLKAAGISGFTQRAAGSDPNSALAFAPFVGVNPNTQTALTTSRQDSISARDAAERQREQDSINATNLERERMQQGGANFRTQYSTDNRPVAAGNNTDVIVTPRQGKALGLKPNEDGQYVLRGRATVGTGQDQMPGTAGGESVAGRERVTKSGTGSTKPPPAVPAQASKRMQSKIEAALKESGVTADAQSLNGLVSAAGTEWQSSKNPDAAADTIIQRLNGGESINGVTLKRGNRTLAGVPIPGTERKSVSRAPASAAATAKQPPPAAVEFLRKNPNLKADFEAKYGPGSAAQFLKQ